ncbi:MAG TPA: GIY-YIG nuclease family protein [Bacteroidia bacterium]|jgi:putative endonuclease|nr:GIY-YIG nuclease family protein [Bacteroidia bacterium]
MGIWFTYIVECSDKTLYTGTTNDIAERIAKHNEGTGAKYTKGRGPVKILYCHSFESRSEACKHEYELKQFSKTAKFDIIKSSHNEISK